MKKSILLMSFSFLIVFIAKSQDTIFIKKGFLKNGKDNETILCKIVKINQTDIVYTENNIEKSISLSMVKNFKVSNETAIGIAENSGINVRKEFAPQPISEIKANSSEKSKGWLILSGVAIAGSGVVNLINSNKKLPDGADLNQMEIFIDSQKNLYNLSSALNIIAGVSLMVGFTIYFK